MKGTIKNDYPIVNRLPGNAMTINKYAEAHGISQAYVYIKAKRGKADYKIVIFQGIVFVIAGNK